MMVNGRNIRLGGKGILPGRIQTGVTGAWLLGASNAALIVLLVTYLALRPPDGGERSVLLQQARAEGGASGEAGEAMASHLEKMRVSHALAAAGGQRARGVKHSIQTLAAEGVKAGAELWKDMQKVAAERPGQQQLASRGRKQVHLQSLACGECAYKDNPLSEIDEPNVFPGPSEFGPDSPDALGPLGNAVNSACCKGTGENAFGAPALSVKEMRKVYEIGEPNFRKWKEFEKENNIFPGIVDWDPDSPKGYNPPFETKELFDGHGGIVGLEDSDGWKITPQSATYRDYSKYADGSTEGMDRNVYANGYDFPDY